MLQSEGAHDVEAQALAAVVGAAGEAALEYVGQVLGRYAAARIAHTDDRVSAFSTQRERYAAPGRRKGKGVVAEVFQRGTQLELSGGDVKLLF